MVDAADIQGRSPKRVVEAWNLTELSDTVRRCAADGLAVVDYGRFHRGFGAAPPEAFAHIATAPGIVEHYVADLTVRVRAATALGDLQRDLTECGQWLPIDGIDARATIGEIIAHNISGPLRAGFGTMRDLLLGLRYVDASGDEIVVGGRTMKNVAGYDVSRFMIGNLNTLGLMTEATLRTFARPEQMTQVTITDVDLTLFDEHGTAMVASDAMPAGVELYRPTGAAPPTLHLVYAGSAGVCEAQFKALERWLGERRVPAGSVEHRRASLKDDQHDRAARQAWQNEANAVVKLIVPPAETGRTMRQLADDGLPPHAMVALPLHGVIRLGGDWSVEQAQQADAAITRRVGEIGGLRLWLTRPQHTPDIDPIAPAQPDWPMLEKIKRAGDPENLFNPRRTPWAEL